MEKETNEEIDNDTDNDWKYELFRSNVFFFRQTIFFFMILTIYIAFDNKKKKENKE